MAVSYTLVIRVPSTRVIVWRFIVNTVESTYYSPQSNVFVQLISKVVSMSRYIYFVEKDPIRFYDTYIKKIILLKFIIFFSSRSKGIKRFLGEEFFRGRNFRGKRKNKKKEKEERKFLLQQRKRNASAREQLISINI